MGEQRPLETHHVPAQDLITAAHGSQPLAVLDAVPGGNNVARLHRDGALACHQRRQTQTQNHRLQTPLLRHLIVKPDVRLSRRSPFSTLVRSLPCLVFSNRGWWPSTSSPTSLQDLSNRAPSPQGAVLRMRQKAKTGGIDATRAILTRRGDRIDPNMKH